MIQYQTVFKDVLFLSFLFIPSLSLQQLALPKQVLAIVSPPKITVNEFLTHSDDYLFSFSVIISKIMFLNNQSHLSCILKNRKVFISIN